MYILHSQTEQCSSYTRNLTLKRLHTTVQRIKKLDSDSNTPIINCINNVKRKDRDCSLGPVTVVKTP
jgi:hypothetical protein